jgi:hypothetical protein
MTVGLTVGEGLTAVERTCCTVDTRTGTAGHQDQADHERALTFTQGTTDEDEHAS